MTIVDDFGHLFLLQIVCLNLISQIDHNRLWLRKGSESINTTLMANVAFFATSTWIGSSNIVCWRVLQQHLFLASLTRRSNLSIRKDKVGRRTV